MSVFRDNHIYSTLSPRLCATLIKTKISFKFKLLENIHSVIMSYRVINIQTVCFSPSLETENMEFSYPCSRPPLSDSTRSPAFNLVPLQMSGRQRASSVTAIDQALFSSAAPMDEVSQGPRQSRTSQLALTGSPQKMPSLSTQPMSFTHIIITTWQTRGERGVVVPWGDAVANASRRGPMMWYDGCDSLVQWWWWG